MGNSQCVGTQIMFLILSLIIGEFSIKNNNTCHIHSVGSAKCKLFTICVSQRENNKLMPT